VSFKAEAAAIHARITAAWIAPPGIYLEGAKRPEGLVEWVVVSVRPARGDQLYVGLPTHRYGGAVVAQCFAEHDNPQTSLARVREIADAFAALWRNATTKLPLQIVDAQAGTMTFFTPYVSDTITQGGLLQMNVAALFQRDHTIT